MQVVTMLLGIVCLLVVLLDAFQTIILPRRAAGRLRLTRIFYILTWMPWRFVALRIRHPRKRETALSFYGPLSLIFLLVVWASGMVFGFSLIYYSLGSPFSDTSQTHRIPVRPLCQRHQFLYARPRRRNSPFGDCTRSLHI